MYSGLRAWHKMRLSRFPRLLCRYCLVLCLFLRGWVGMQFRLAISCLYWSLVLPVLNVSRLRWSCQTRLCLVCRLIPDTCVLRSLCYLVPVCTPHGPVKSFTIELFGWIRCQCGMLGTRNANNFTNTNLWFPASLLVEIVLIFSVSLSCVSQVLPTCAPHVSEVWVSLSRLFVSMYVQSTSGWPTKWGGKWWLSQDFVERWGFCRTRRLDITKIRIGRMYVLQFLSCSDT